MSNTLPLDLNSAPLGIGRHVSGIADPFDGLRRTQRAATACRGRLPDGVRAIVRCRPGAAVVAGLRTHAVAVTAASGWSIDKWGGQFSASAPLDEAYVPFFGAFGVAWDSGRGTQALGGRASPVRPHKHQVS